MTVLLLSDRLARTRELTLYLEKKAQLEWRLELIRREIRLTDDILKLIKREMS